MSEHRTKLLRNRAAALRNQAATGELVAVSVREVVQGVPRELVHMVNEQVHTGALGRRYQDALARASRQGLDDGDAVIAGLSEVLVGFTREVGRLINERLEELEKARQRAIGRADGIEEALADLAPAAAVVESEAEPAGDAGRTERA